MLSIVNKNFLKLKKLEISLNGGKINSNNKNPNIEALGISPSVTNCLITSFPNQMDLDRQIIFNLVLIW